MEEKIKESKSQLGLQYEQIKHWRERQSNKDMQMNTAKHQSLPLSM